MIQEPIPAYHAGKSASHNRSVRPVMLADINQKRKPYTSLDDVLKICAQIARKYRGDMRIRDHAIAIVKHHPAFPKNIQTGHPDFRNFDAIADAIYTWMKDNIVYKRDPYRIEWLQTPDVTASKKSGDCDDMSTLAASLLGSLGIRTRFKTTGTAKNSFNHIYLEYQNQSGNWIPFDVTMATHAGDEIPENHRVSEKFTSLDDGNLGLISLGHDSLGTGQMFQSIFGSISGDDRAAARAQTRISENQARSMKYIAWGLGGLGAATVLGVTIYAISKS